MSNADRVALVTGASGLIGSQVVRQLAADPGGIESVVALDVRDVPAEARLPGIAYETGDIRDPELEKLLRTRQV